MSKLEDEKKKKDNAEVQESEKLVDNEEMESVPEDKESSQEVEQNNSTGEITLEQFKNALESNIECKGYFDSLVDKSVSKRLNKGIDSWKASNLDNLIEEEINKRYPQKSETEIALEKIQEEKRQLELQIKYQKLMNDNNLPLDILEFVSGKDEEDTVNKIEKFNKILAELIEKHREKWVDEYMKECSYIPPGDNGHPSDYSHDMWAMMK